MGRSGVSWERSAYDVARAHGAAAATHAETLAYIGVLDRMGDFSRSERDILVAAGWLGVNPFDVEDECDADD